MINVEHSNKVQNDRMQEKQMLNILRVDVSHFVCKHYQNITWKRNKNLKKNHYLGNLAT